MPVIRYVLNGCSGACRGDQPKCEHFPPARPATKTRGRLRPSPLVFSLYLSNNWIKLDFIPLEAEWDQQDSGNKESLRTLHWLQFISDQRTPDRMKQMRALDARSRRVLGVCMQLRSASILWKLKLVIIHHMWRDKMICCRDRQDSSYVFVIFFFNSNSFYQ